MFETKVAVLNRANPQVEILQEAAALLAAGEVVAFPTETVYGLGANALDANAAAKIFAAKDRPADNPLIVHIAKVEELQTVAQVPESALRLAAAFWPGPLTLVLPRKAAVPPIVSAGLDTVAVRLPADPLARALVETAGFPIAAPSANRSGRPSPTTAAHVLEDMAGRIPLILDGGPVDIGLESTVLDLCGQTPAILRPGKLTAADLAPLLGRVEYASGILAENERPQAPGMKYRHYAPRGEVIAASAPTLARLYHESPSPKPFVVACRESRSLFPADAPYFQIADLSDLAGFAQNLFAAFRLADQAGAKRILVETVPEQGLGIAIMNRLKKAAKQVLD